MLLDFDLSMLALGVVEYTRMRMVKVDAQDSGRHSDYMVSETARKVCILSVKGPHYTASDLDSDTAMIKLWEVEDN